MKLTLIFLIIILFLSIPQGFSLTKNKLAVSYSDNFSLPYELEIDSNQSYLLSQSYSWIRDQSSRYNLIGYSIDDGGFIQISRTARGNFTIDIPMDKPHSIVLFAIPQFPLVVGGVSKYEFVPNSPTGDNWFDSNTEVKISHPAIVERSEDTREIITGWTLDNGEVHFVNDDVSGILLTDAILMTDSHQIDFYSKIQYKVDVISNYGDAFGSGWYDANSNVSISVKSPNDVIFGKVFDGWEGSNVKLQENPSMIVIDSPKTIMARWSYDYTPFVFSFIIIGVSLVFFIKYRQKTKESQIKQKEKTVEKEIISDDKYDPELARFLEEKTLEGLESYLLEGIIDEARYSRIKKSLQS
jgi:hypothetical protein